MSKKLSQRLGETMAHVQDLADTMVHILIKRVNSSSHGASISDKLVKFVTSFGDSYFKKYTEIKGRENK
ncbi:MAG: hypothetical protein ABIA75_07580 [Candidatus Neomarinimicrobiota bacterium]